MATLLLKMRCLGLNPSYLVWRGLRGGGRVRPEIPIGESAVDHPKLNVLKSEDFLAQLENEADKLRTKFESSKQRKDAKHSEASTASLDGSVTISKKKEPIKTSDANHERSVKSLAKDSVDVRSNKQINNMIDDKFLEDSKDLRSPKYDGRNKKHLKKNHSKIESNNEEQKDLPPSKGVYADLIKDLKSKVNSASVTLENKDEKVKDVMTILHFFPYTKQLELKHSKHTEVLKRLSKSLSYNVSKKCSSPPVIRSPATEAYRSKDEFSVHVGVDGKPTVGFFVGNPKDGMVCVEPTAISIIKEEHKLVAKCYQDYIRQSSLPPHLYMGPIVGGEQGNWRSMFVRSNQAGDLMGKIIFHPQQLSGERIQEEKEKLVEYFTAGDGRACGLKSLYIVVTKDLFNSASKDRPELSFGSTHITETMEGISFRLGPETFYQINVKCAELLLDVVKEQANLDGSRTLLDLCCGAGFFSIHLAQMVRGCLGVDMLGIEDARKNAELNEMTNCSFLKGKVQEVVPGLIQQLSPLGGKISVVLNPGREGVDFRVIQHVRRSRMIDSIVYVSCHPESNNAFVNLRDLLKEDSKKTEAKLKSEPFKLEKAIPVDMFPHTQHCEHVFVFRR